MSTIIPIPQIPISIRTATIDDFAAIDAIQKQYNKQLGFFPRAQMEGYLKNGWVMVAEENLGFGVQGSVRNPLNPEPQPLNPRIVGYCASRDRYLKRDELGAIFQLCVAQGSQRKFVGMTLLKAVFERAPYGCKLFCCWCAQDIEANRFWEAMGFVPLAFRAGSAKKSRVHIFWQKRIREGDNTTPWWFPSQTGGGSIREDRLVLPIPPERRWDEEMPRILPKSTEMKVLSAETKCKRLSASNQHSALRTQHRPTPHALGGWNFTPPAPAKQKKNAGGTPTPRKKNDPKLIAVARELRDRWLEKVNEEGFALPAGKYDVSRQLEAHPTDGADTPLLIEQRSIAA